MTEFEALLLKVLQDSGRAHGLHIGSEYERRTNRRVKVGSLYKTLHRLEAEGFVRSFWEDRELESAHPGPKRRYYVIEGAGSEALTAYTRDLERTLQSLQMRPA
jgi:DNA-binding PadR family transcriptional regulator